MDNTEKPSTSDAICSSMVSPAAGATSKDLGSVLQLLCDRNSGLRKRKTPQNAVDPLGHLVRSTTKKSGTLVRKQVRDLLERQGYACALTGIALTPETAVLDHIFPVSRGGDILDPANWQIVHKEINRMKGALTEEEFLEWVRLLSMHNVP